MGTVKRVPKEELPTKEEVFPSPYDAVTFVGDVGEPKAASVAALHVKAAVDAAPIRVRVRGNYRVVHPEDGTAHSRGDVLEVPRDTADIWIKAGWVTAETTKEK